MDELTTTGGNERIESIEDASGSHVSATRNEGREGEEWDGGMGGSGAASANQDRVTFGWITLFLRFRERSAKKEWRITCGILKNKKCGFVLLEPLSWMHSVSDLADSRSSRMRASGRAVPSHVEQTFNDGKHWSFFSRHRNRQQFL